MSRKTSGRVEKGRQGGIAIVVTTESVGRRSDICSKYYQSAEAGSEVE
jgi:hypothetical protein